MIQWVWPSESPSTHQNFSVAKAHQSRVDRPIHGSPDIHCLSDRCRGCSCCFSWRRRRPVSTTADTRTSASTPKHTHTLTRTHTHTHTHARAHARAHAARTRQAAPATDCPSDGQAQLGNGWAACAGTRASAPALAPSYRWLPKLFVAEKLHNRLHACRGRHDRSKGLPGVFTKEP